LPKYTFQLEVVTFSYHLRAYNKFSIFFLHSRMVQFISFTSSSHASCFFILLKCNGCFGSHTFSFPLYPSTNFMTLSWIHSICKTQWQKCTRNHKTLHICTSLHDRNMRNEKKRRGANSGLRVTLHIHTCSSHNRIIPDATAKYRHWTK